MAKGKSNRVSPIKPRKQNKNPLVTATPSRNRQPLNGNRREKGCVQIGDVVEKGGGVTQVQGLSFLDLADNNRLRRIAGLYTFVKWHKLRVHFRPTLAYTESGTIHASAVCDPRIVVGAGMTTDEIMAGTSAKAWHVTQPAFVDVPIFLDQHYTFPSREDWRLSSPGLIQYQIAGCSSSDEEVIGFWELEYDITLMAPQAYNWYTLSSIEKLKASANLTSQEFSGTADTDVGYLDATNSSDESVAGKTAWHTAVLSRSADLSTKTLKLAGYAVALGTRLWFRTHARLFNDAADTMAVDSSVISILADSAGNPLEATLSSGEAFDLAKSYYYSISR
jgi:hypothetical protein